MVASALAPSLRFAMVSMVAHGSFFCNGLAKTFATIHDAAMPNATLLELTAADVLRLNPTMRALVGAVLRLRVAAKRGAR